jgi:hypothetical protein
MKEYILMRQELTISPPKTKDSPAPTGLLSEADEFYDGVAGEFLRMFSRF